MPRKTKQDLIDELSEVDEQLRELSGRVLWLQEKLIERDDLILALLGFTQAKPREEDSP